MIYTVTFNPSLDYVVKVDNFAVGEINRTQVENIYPGGKGINVSLVLQNLGLHYDAVQPRFPALRHRKRPYPLMKAFYHLAKNLSYCELTG